MEKFIVNNYLPLINHKNIIENYYWIQGLPKIESLGGGTKNFARKGG